MAFTMTCLNFKNGLKMASGLLGVNSLRWDLKNFKKNLIQLVSCGPLGVKSLWSNSIVLNIIKITFRNLSMELKISEGITLPRFFLI
jgi:hypothetical protein